MNPKAATIATLFATAATSTLTAHPGPPGHTHEGSGDDWPFDPIVASAIIAVAIAAAAFATRAKLRGARIPK